MVEGLLIRPFSFFWPCARVNAECVFCIGRVMVVLGMEDGCSMVKSWCVVRFRDKGRGIWGDGEELLWEVV